MFSQDIESLIQYIISLGAKPYIVGGYVRDQLLNIKNPILDLDLEVYGLEFNQLVAKLEEQYNVRIQGEFGVIKIEGIDVEIALPRTESKVGVSHRDFLINIDPFMKISQARLRRDFTINTIMYDLSNKQLIITEQAKKDLDNRILRNVSEKFSEDPLRVLRTVRFSITHDLSIEPQTYQLCQRIANQLKYISDERKAAEWLKIMNGNYINEQQKALRLVVEDYFLTNQPIINHQFLPNQHMYNNYLIFKHHFDCNKYISEFIIGKKQQVHLRKLLNITKLENNDIEQVYDLSNQKNEFITDYLLIQCEYFKKNNEEIAKVKEMIEKINELKKEYNGYYFLEQKIDKSEIKFAQKQFICKIIKHS